MGRRPPEWVDSEGRQVLSHADTLFSAPVAPGELVSNGWGEVDALALTEHIGRRVIQGCKSRDFRDGWRKNPDTGKVSPRVYRVGTAALARCQYAVLTHPQRTAVLVLDVDRPHEPGGTVDNLHPEVWKGLTALVAAGLGPAWVGINPVNGKCQLLWLIDPVYAAAGQTSANMRLLSVVTDELNTLLAADHRFSHQFSRWPLHVSDDPTRYRWHCQHSLVMRLGDICKEVRAMNGTANRPRRHTEVQYASGRERIEAARAATAKRKREFVHPSSRDPNVIEGVRVYWVSDGRAARDETAFRHALVTGYRLKESGQKLTDAALIDAYEYAYDLAQSIGADWREPDMPPYAGQANHGPPRTRLRRRRHHPPRLHRRPRHVCGRTQSPRHYGPQRRPKSRPTMARQKQHLRQNRARSAHRSEQAKADRCAGSQAVNCWVGYGTLL